MKSGVNGKAAARMFFHPSGRFNDFESTRRYVMQVASPRELMTMFRLAAKAHLYARRHRLALEGRNAAGELEVRAMWRLQRILAGLEHA